jgi:hypothetical protein
MEESRVDREVLMGIAARRGLNWSVQQIWKHTSV